MRTIIALILAYMLFGCANAQWIPGFAGDMNPGTPNVVRATF